VGHWIFEEFWQGLSGQTDGVVYDLEVRRSGSKPIAVISGDGFMTGFRVEAIVVFGFLAVSGG
jgi:hypothetical protein